MSGHMRMGRHTSKKKLGATCRRFAMVFRASMRGESATATPSEWFDV